MKVLFVTYGGGHAHMVYPVVHALRASQAFAADQLEIEVLALPAATYTLRSRGVETLGFRDFIDPVRDAAALARGEALAKIHHSPTVGVAHEDSVAYLGLCFQDLVDRHGQAEAEALMASRGRQAFLPLTVMERIFDRLKPDLVVTSNSPRSEAAALAVANGRGIGTLAMTDLFTGLGGYQIRAQGITFLNAMARDMFLEDGLVDPSASEFYLTGNPAFDSILELPREAEPGWMAANFPGVGGRKAVLHADMPAWWNPVTRASHFKNDAETLAELDACHAATLANGAAYLVRPHPSQNRALYEGWVQGREHAFLAADCKLHDLLRHADLLLARTTTVGLEAALLRRRILQLEAHAHPDLPLAAMGVAWGSRGMQHLAAEIGQSLADDAGFARILERMDRSLPAEPAASKIAGIVLSKLQLAASLHTGAPG